MMILSIVWSVSCFIIGVIVGVDMGYDIGKNSPPASTKGGVINPNKPTKRINPSKQRKK